MMMLPMRGFKLLTAGFGTLACLGLMSSASAADLDKDGLDDQFENELLARYRPYYLFSSDETKWPLPATTYVNNTEVKAAAHSGAATFLSVQRVRQDPLSILRVNRPGTDYCSYWDNRWACMSDLTLNARPTNYALNALDNPPGGFVGASPFDGFNSQAIVTQGNVGLYGHVVPITLSSVDFPCEVRWNKVERPAANAPGAVTYYKVEYWQYFGFNDAHQSFGIGNHEADWTTVQLLIRPATIIQTPCSVTPTGICTIPGRERVAAVMHFAHGLEFRFVLNKAQPDSIWYRDGMRFGEFHGANHGQPISLNQTAPWCNATVKATRNHTLRMVRDPGTGQWTHPAVYIERDAHEFWPTPLWDFWRKVGAIRYFAPTHRGDGLRFLTAPPPNLGEVEAPIGTDTNTMLVLRFNGRWGADNSYNTPPYGPPLHAQWTWPASSSIGWQLPENLDY